MHFAEFFLPEDEMILTSRKLGANKYYPQKCLIKKKYQKKYIYILERLIFLTRGQQDHDMLIVCYWRELVNTIG